MNDPKHSENQTKEASPRWEAQDMARLVEAVKRRNAAAGKPLQKQKSKSLKKVNEVLSRIFDD